MIASEKKEIAIFNDKLNFNTNFCSHVASKMKGGSSVKEKHQSLTNANETLLNQSDVLPKTLQMILEP